MNIDNLIVCLAIVSCIMFTASVIMGLYVMMFIKLFRDDIKKERNNDKEMKEISGNNNLDEIRKRNNLKDFLRKTSLEKSNIDFDYSSIDTKEEIKKVDREYGEEEIDFIHEKLIENSEKVGLDEKSIKEELESVSIRNFDNNDIPYQSKIERSIEETDTSLSFIENEPTIEPIIEDTEIIFEKQNDNLSLDLFRALSNEQQLKVAKTLIQEKFNVEDCPKDCKDILISKKLEKYCKNASIIDFDDKKVTVNKDFNTGKYKFDFDEPTKTAIEDIYKCNHDNYHNQGYQL